MLRARGMPIAQVHVNFDNLQMTLEAVLFDSWLTCAEMTERVELVSVGAGTFTVAGEQSDSPAVVDTDMLAAICFFLRILVTIKFCTKTARSFEVLCNNIV